MAAQAALAQTLEQTLNPAYAKQGTAPRACCLVCVLTAIAAEATLKTEAKTRADFLTSLLNLIASNDVALPIRQAAALFFKNFVREHWKVPTPLPPHLSGMLTRDCRMTHRTN
jgi:hypothetical protein